MSKPRGTTFNNQASLAAIQGQKRTRKANAAPAGGGGGVWAKHNAEAATRAETRRAGLPPGLLFGGMENFDGAGQTITGTSIFDPVLTELCYRWFCPPGGLILDPFAGGSVRGIVASKLGRAYLGVELRTEQVAANRAQAAAIYGAPDPVWHVGDSRQIDQILPDTAADFLFSCPPYADLEVYSDDPADLSTMAYADFREAYFEIVVKAAAMLRPDRFACFVVGEVRGAGGGYLGLVPDTIEAFRRAGLAYYNEAILEPGGWRASPMGMFSNDRKAPGRDQHRNGGAPSDAGAGAGAAADQDRACCADAARVYDNRKRGAGLYQVSEGGGER